MSTLNACFGWIVFACLVWAFLSKIDGAGQFIILAILAMAVYAGARVAIQWAEGRE